MPSVPFTRSPIELWLTSVTNQSLYLYSCDCPGVARIDGPTVSGKGDGHICLSLAACWRRISKSGYINSNPLYSTLHRRLQHQTCHKSSAAHSARKAYLQSPVSRVISRIPEHVEIAGMPLWRSAMHAIPVASLLQALTMSFHSGRMNTWTWTCLLTPTLPT